MRDPRRLDEGDATSFERQLLDAAKRQVPGAALKARMQEGLGLAGATVPVQVVGKSIALGWKTSVVLALVAVVGTAVTVPLVIRNRGATMLAAEAQAPTGTPPATANVPSSASNTGMSRLTIPVVGETNVSGSLTEEIRLLDRVRGAMSAGEPRRALAELQRYDEQYPRGLFRPEAIVLRVEALDKAGDSQAARLLGRQFLTRYPKNPLADRVARIVRR